MKGWYVVMIEYNMDGEGYESKNSKENKTRDALWYRAKETAKRVVLASAAIYYRATAQGDEGVGVNEIHRVLRKYKS